MRGKKTELVDSQIWNVGTEDPSLFPCVTIGSEQDGFQGGFAFPTCPHRHRKWERAAACAVKEGVKIAEALLRGESVKVVTP